MKKFTRSLLYFFAPLILLFAFAFVFIDISAKTGINEYKIDKSINKLALGDSHMRLAIDDALVPRIKNLAHLSESFVYTYNKLDRLSSSNPHIDTVYIGVSFHSFADYYDKHSVGEFVLGRYFFTLAGKEQIKLLRMAEDPFKLLFKTTIIDLKDLLRKKGRYKWLGAYDNEFSETAIEAEAIRTRIDAQYYRDGELRHYSDLNIEYFSKIISLCRERSIVLIAVNTPMHQDYIMQVPEKFKTRYYSIIEKNQLALIEFAALDSVWSVNHFTPDGDHLSKEGSMLVADFFQLPVSAQN